MTAAVQTEVTAITVALHFTPLWCEKFFRISEDSNEALHGQGGQGIVQAAAVLTKVSTEIGKYMHGYLVERIDEIVFKKPIFIDDIVILVVNPLAISEWATKLDVQLYKEGCEVLHAQVSLVSEKILNMW